MAANPAGHGMIADARRAARGGDLMGDWFFCCRPAPRIGGFLPWCARTAVLGNSPLDVDFNEEVHFAFGESEGEALAALKKAVFQ